MSGLGNKEILAKNLKRYIESSGKDRKELAEIWGFPYSTLTDWINAKKYPRIDRIQIMADYFGIMKSDLVEEKLTEEKSVDNDIISDIIVRLRIDKDFLSLVEHIYPFNKEQIESVQSMLNAFVK